MADHCIITLVGIKPVDIYSDEPVHVTFESVVKWILFFNEDDILIFFNPHLKNLQACFARLAVLHHLLA